MRGIAGRQPLALSPKLQRAAQGHADHMAQVEQMAHSRIGDGDMSSRLQAVEYRFFGAAENVAFRQKTVSQVIADWMKSPGHKRNILGDYIHFGGAVAYGPHGDAYWCTVFANPGTHSVSLMTDGEEDEPAIYKEMTYGFITETPISYGD